MRDDNNIKEALTLYLKYKESSNILPPNERKKLDSIINVCEFQKNEQVSEEIPNDKQDIEENIQPKIKEQKQGIEIISEKEDMKNLPNILKTESNANPKIEEKIDHHSCKINEDFKDLPQLESVNDDLPNSSSKKTIFFMKPSFEDDNSSNKQFILLLNNKKEPIALVNKMDIDHVYFTQDKMKIMFSHSKTNPIERVFPLPSKSEIDRLYNELLEIYE